MQIPLKIAYHDVEESKRVDDLIAGHAGKLEQFYDRITSCRVTVTAPGRVRNEGTIYSVRIDLTVPGREIVVNRQHGKDARHKDIEFAVNDAFHAARRMLEDHVRESRHKVKRHETPPHGRVSKFFPDDGYGFIETSDGREVYFSEKSVLAEGARIAVGEEVRFVEEAGEKGPNATSVRPVGRHHHIAPGL
jgi:cold shock CspA family protein